MEKRKMSFVGAIAVSFAVGVLVGYWEPLSSSHIGLLLQGATVAVAAFGAYVAYLGVDTWRRQLIGKDEYELAKRALLNTYELEKVFADIRNPYTAEDSKPLDKFFQVGAELDLAFLEGKVQWGKDFYALKKNFVDARQKVFTARRKIADAQDTRISREERSRIWDEYSAIAECYSDDASDEFSREVASAVEKLELALESHLKK